MKSTLRNLMVGTFAVAAFVGCDNNDVTSPDPSEGAPILPPAESMRFDMSHFESGTARLSDLERQSAANWIQAVGTAVVVSAFVADMLYTPALAFELAVHTVPSPQSDGSYLWVYTWVDEENDHEVQVRLRGAVDGDAVTWELRISDNLAVPAFDQFLWFHGESAIDGSEGFWVFNDRNELAMSMEVARIDWHHNSETDASVALQATDPSDPDVGDTLTYAIDDTNASISLLDASETMTWFVQWDTVTGAGSLQVPEYNDGDEACWDDGLQDVACTPPTS